jgi:hypothetical protein
MKRLSTLILIFALMFAFTASALAQTGDMACGDLSDEDCEILYASADAMQGVTSGTSSIWVEAQASNVPQTPFQQIGFDFSLDVSSSMDDDAADQAMALETLSGDPAEIAQAVSTILRGTSASIDMTTNFSEELAALLTTDPSMAFPTSVALSLIMDSGVLYIDLAALESVMGDMEGMAGWIGVDIDPLVQQSILQSAQDPAASNVVMVSGSTTGGGPLFTQLAVLDPTGEVSQFLTLERLDDDEVEGEDVAVFRTGVNWDAFVQSPYFEQLVVSLMMQDPEAMPTQAEIDQTVTLGRMFGPSLLQGITLELIEMVSLDTNYLVGTEFSFFWDLSDLAALAQMVGGAEMEIDADSTISISISTSNTGLNEDVEIEVPADAFILPAEMLNSMMMGGAQ